jgi:glycosyltransferase involved in cell wall biosynthesis
MRVAFLTHEPFYPPSGGGSAEAIYLVEELVRRGHGVQIFCPQVADPASVQARFGVELQEFKAWKMGRYASLRTFKYLAYPFLLQRMVETASRRTRFDLVLSQHAISAVAAGRLKKNLRLPVIMNFLDYLTGFMETWPPYLAPRPLLAALERFELSLPLRHHADAILTVSDTLADYFAQAGYPRRRILPIYYGYDSTLFSPRGAEANCNSRPVLVMHGSFDHHHLGPIARDAMAYVFQRKPETLFKFVGQRTPALRKFVEGAQKRMPGLAVECAGFVPYAEISPHLSSATIGIVPYEESTGTHCAFVAKIVEYLAVGLPVVSTPLNSACRYFGKEPLVRFSAFEGTSFGEKIMSWLNEPLEQRRALAPAASARVKSELDWREIAKRAIDFVEEIQSAAKS